MEKAGFMENMRGSFAHKFASKKEVIEGNMNAIRCRMGGGQTRMSKENPMEGIKGAVRAGVK